MHGWKKVLKYSKIYAMHFLCINVLNRQWSAQCFLSLSADTYIMEHPAFSVVGPTTCQEILPAFTIFKNLTIFKNHSFQLCLGWACLWVGILKGRCIKDWLIEQTGMLQVIDHHSSQLPGKSIMAFLMLWLIQSPFWSNILLKGKCNIFCSDINT